MQVGVEGIVVVDVLVVAEAGRREINPAELSRAPDALPAVLELQVEVLLARRNVAVREKLLTQRLEFPDKGGGWLTETYHHVYTQQKNGICKGLSIGF